MLDKGVRRPHAGGRCDSQ